MSHAGMPRWGHGHAVSWYALDSEGIEAVARFVAHGWAESDSALIIAPASHRARLEAEIALLGTDPERMRAQGRYVVRDADEALRLFLSDGVLDPQRFRAVVGELLTEASRDGSHVRVFSELIALLWQRDEVTNALELELLWRSLLRERDFSLLCAYPARDFDRSRLVDVRRVCDLHTDLVVASPAGRNVASGSATQLGGPDRIAGADEPSAAVVVGRYHACSRVYLPVAESVPDARHFVTDVLRAWGLDALDPDAAIVVSELATNALRHADTPFRAILDRHHDGVRIGVEDAAHDPLARRSPPDSYALGGRGVDIVEALSRRWGSTELPSGKLVWAELAERVASASEAG